MENGRRIGRQPIPQEFFQREEQLKRAALSQSIDHSSSDKLLNAGTIESKKIEVLKQMAARNPSPSFSKYADKNSLPYSMSLRAIANKSVAGLYGSSN